MHLQQNKHICANIIATLEKVIRISTNTLVVHQKESIVWSKHKEKAYQNSHRSPAKIAVSLEKLYAVTHLKNRPPTANYAIQIATFTR